MNTFENKTIVAFHIGRGGRFYNAGFLTYLGEENISHYIDSLFLNADKSQYVDSNGNEVGLSVDDCNNGIGCINIDNDYNTTYTTYLDNLSDAEFEAIKAYKGWRGLDVESFLEDLEN